MTPGVLRETIMRPRSTTALVALSIALGGCLGGTANRGLESVHQPVISRSDYALDVSADAGGLAPGETRRLADWFDSIGLAYGDRVYVDDPSGYGSGIARDDVRAVAGRYGLMVADGAPVTAGNVAPGAVRVVVTRTDASVPGCPDWSRGSVEFSGSTMSNYGCGVNSALAAMIANPEDLLRGQDPAASVDASTAGKAIKSYRDRKPTGDGELKKESAGGR